MKKLQDITSDLFDKSLLTNEEAKRIHGGVSDPGGDGSTVSTICQGEPNTTHPSGTFGDNDPCTDN